MITDAGWGADALDYLDTAIIRLDGGGHIIALNAAATQCIGMGLARAKGKALSAVTPLPEDLARSLEALPEGGRSFHLQELRMHGGCYDCSVQTIHDGDVLLEFHDLSWEHNRSRLQKSELQAGLMKLLSRNLGHEIRNPLGGIRGAAQMLAKELESDLELPELAELSRMIMRESDRIEELIARFGQPQLEMTACDIYPLITEVVELVMAEFDNTVRVERDFDPSLPPVCCDPVAVRQILLNLMRNACQSGARNIALRTRIVHEPALLQSPRPALQIDVMDDGEGVPPAIRPLLFLPLMSGRRDGTGLGLALAQQMAAAHHGILSYEPRGGEQGDSGSCFTLLLPIRQTDD